jgi:hypothetical protein
MVNPNLFFEFRKESLKAERDLAPKKEEEVKVEPRFDVFTSLKKISELPPTHPARRYVTDRKVPDDQLGRLFYAPYFKKFVNTIVPEKFSKDAMDEPRLIIPYIAKDGSVMAFTGRSFDPAADLRYMMINLTDDRAVFGLDRVDTNRQHYVVEGPIDALFLPDTIAVGGSYIRDWKNGIAIFDNQPRNYEICKLMQSAIENDMKIVIWPPNLPGKDINELVLAGYTVKEILEVIKQNTYYGLTAKLKFNEWKRV